MPEEMLIGGRYRLGELIGTGGEARVYRARDRQENREVALRFPDHAASAADTLLPPEFHPGWVRLLDRGLDARGAYHVFELLEGETLRRQMEGGPLALDDWLAFVRQSLHAVEALHQAGWVHGDLNAENFLQLGASPRSWKLLELPFLHTPAPAGRSVAFGSIHTLAPEQLTGATANARSDLYALGCLYYYAATGAYPHPGANAQEIAISLLRFPAVPLDEKVPRWPERLTGGVMRLLERDPRQRCPSVAAARQLLAIA